VSSERGGEQRTVMVVEDDDDIREIFAEVLKSRGYDVVQASSGSEALAHLRGDSTRPDLILLDLMMPDMDGRQFMLERDASLTSIPVVVVTAAGAQKQRAAGIQADGWLSKPVDLDRLLAAVAKYCRTADPRPMDAESAAALLGEPRIAQFLARRRAEIPTLRDAVAVADFVEIRSIAHNLKGVGLSFGFARISEIGERMEKLALRGDSESTLAAIDELERFLATERS
jgi:CheY-like chemotaxis protein